MKHNTLPRTSEHSQEKVGEVPRNGDSMRGGSAGSRSPQHPSKQSPFLVHPVMASTAAQAWLIKGVLTTGGSSTAEGQKVRYLQSCSNPAHPNLSCCLAWQLSSERGHAVLLLGEGILLIPGKSLNERNLASAPSTSGMTEVWHHRHKQLKAARGAVPICTLETRPMHPVFARKQRCLLSLTKARALRFASRFASSFPWAPGSRMPVSTSDERWGQGYRQTTSNGREELPPQRHFLL